ncbi:MAG: hypothetical protein IKZ98_09635 [Clostridia bacterium]|nr:hypothetical protein [Clostridia bacterium]
MIQPEELRSATDKALSGLTADESLKQRILLKASQSTQTSRDSVFRPVMKLCAVVGVLLLMVVALNSVRPLSPSAPGEMNVFAAGGKDTAAAAPFAQIDIDHVSGITVGGIVYQNDDRCADMIRILQSEAKETDADIPANGEQIVIQMDDGTEHTFGISEPYVYSNDKCWICSGFFSLIQNAGK